MLGLVAALLVAVLVSPGRNLTNSEDFAEGFTALKFDPAGPYTIYDGRQPDLQFLGYRRYAGEIVAEDRNFQGIRGRAIGYFRDQDGYVIANRHLIAHLVRNIWRHIRGQLGEITGHVKSSTTSSWAKLIGGTAQGPLINLNVPFLVEPLQHLFNLGQLGKGLAR